MFGKSFTLFRLFGFAVGLDASWIFLALLVTWTLASGLFPQQFEGLSAGVYWSIGIVGAIGLFVRHASQMSYQQALVRHTLEGEEVTRFMNESPVCVPPEISIQELVDDYIYRHHFKTFPVVEGDKHRRMRQHPRHSEHPARGVEGAPGERSLHRMQRSKHGQTAR